MLHITITTKQFRERTENMRLRNIPGSREQIAASDFCVPEPAQYKGRWQEIFGNSNPIQIEIGMGKGRFLMELAHLHPEFNFIGIEMYSSVLVRALEKAEKEKENEKEAGSAASNFRFLRMDARELPEVFAPGEVQKIYLNFSDPWPKDRHAKRRLTSLEFLRRYEQVLPDGAVVEFKTDNPDLFAFSLEQAALAGWTVLAQTDDLHNDPVLNAGNVMTEYEEKFAAEGKPIHKLIMRPATISALPVCEIK